MFKLSKRSYRNLAGVHPDLVSVVELAITLTPVDFGVLEGMRSKGRQQELYVAGASSTMTSRHLTGHAVDLGAFLRGERRWDWPLYERISKVMLESARTLGVHVTWGGSWDNFKDGPHYELGRGTYPDKGG